MIIRYLVVDPAPPHPLDDMIVYQVPENSRAAKLLEVMLTAYNLEWVKVNSPPPAKRKSRK